MCATVENRNSSTVMCYKKGRFVASGAKNLAQAIEALTIMCEILSRKLVGEYIFGDIQLNNVVTTIYPRYMIDVKRFYADRPHHSSFEAKGFPGLNFARAETEQFKGKCNNINMTIFIDSVTVTGCTSRHTQAHVYYESLFGDDAFSLVDGNGQFIENPKFIKHSSKK